jgi:hypothetical protein
LPLGRGNLVEVPQEVQITSRNGRLLCQHRKKGKGPAVFGETVP